MRVSVVSSAIWLGLIGSVTTAQELDQPQVVCTIGGCKEIVLPKPRYSDASAFSTQQVWTVVNDILSVSGLLPNFQVVETEKVDNAAAVVIEGERYLAFNPDWIARYKSDPNVQWQLYGVMAHEIGHHLQGHTITGNGSRPPTELEADEYAGFTLSALGASLNEAQSLWTTLSESGSVTHPPRHQRLAAVERGWIRRKGQIPETARHVARIPAPSAPPPPSWALRNCISVSAANRPADLCFSSYLPPQSGNTYGPHNARDGNPHTAWIEGVSGHGIGQHFSLVFVEPARINSFRIRNGYAKSDRVYSRNGRIRELRVIASNGEQATFALRDTSDWQEIGAIANIGPVSWITFEIAGVYSGTHYQDTAITELAFD